MLRKDIENELGPVYDLELRRRGDGPCLRRREIVVEDDEFDKALYSFIRPHGMSFMTYTATKMRHFKEYENQNQ